MTRSIIRTTALTVLAAITVFILFVYLLGAWRNITETPHFDPAPVSDNCQEDDPCWDCATMGNMICGEVQIGTPLHLPEEVVEVELPHTT